jgi:hypothetical protein
MATGSPKLYLRRKKHIDDMREPRPMFATNTMRSHRRPHVTLPELRVVERPEARLATRPIEETPAYEGDKEIE